MLYPCSILLGENSKSESLGIAYAGHAQEQDTGVKVIHIGKSTSSITRAKSLSQSGGISTYRGLIKVAQSAIDSKVLVECDALMLDEQSTSKTYPAMDILTQEVTVSHEAKVGSLSHEKLSYLAMRGFSQAAAKQFVVKGFSSPIVSKFPLEYAAELNKLLELEVIEQ
jgi:Fe-S cluster assembly protein SufB